MRQYRYITKTKPQGLVGTPLPVIRNYVEYDADELWTRVVRCRPWRFDQKQRPLGFSANLDWLHRSFAI